MTWRARLIVVAATTIAAATTTACGDDPGERPLRVVPVPIQKLDPPPGATDTEIHADVVMGALSDMSDPVAKVDLSQDDQRIEVRVWIYERVPAADERIPGLARSYTADISLDAPVGNADIVDMAVDPPRLVPLGR